MTSLFSQWRSTAAGEDGTQNANEEEEQHRGPLTAPGGWGNLLTWRGPRIGQRTVGVSGVEGAGLRQESDDGDAKTFRRQQLHQPESPQQGFATAKTRARGATTLRPRAPIPSFEPPPPPSSSSSSIAVSSDVKPKRSSLKVKGMDSADVSAELRAETSAADLSMDAGALDSAFETLTRIKAKDVAASYNQTAPSTSLLPPLRDQVIDWSKHTRLVSASSTEAPSSRKASLAYHTPEESPTQPNTPSAWMQWGTSRIRATLPRGIASALLSVIGDTEEKSGDRSDRALDKEDEVANDAMDDTIEADMSVLDLQSSQETDLEIIRDCIDVICGNNNDGVSLLDTEGVFRVSPSSALLRSTKEAYARGEIVLLSELTEQDRHLPAALLKDRLRIMRPPLVPESMYVDVSGCPSKRQDAIKYIRTNLLPELGTYNLSVLRQVMACANQVSRRSDENKMDSTNLALVLTPNLVNGHDVLQDMKMCEVSKEGGGQAKGMTLGNVVQLCIERYDDVFIGL